eukprot:Transcript_28453.p3 GENE.Transcript_28453~~Transcript_28453.p3  ORF type:complete len:338 (+),score=78.87 Transcript_28453:108-1016(+)
MRTSVAAVAVVSAGLLGYSFRGPHELQPCSRQQQESDDAQDAYDQWADGAPKRPRLPPKRPRLPPKRPRKGPTEQRAERLKPHAKSQRSADPPPPPPSASAASTAADAPASSVLAHLVTDAAVQATLGFNKISEKHARSYGCTFSLIKGTLYRATGKGKCNPKRPNWQLLTALLVSAVARAQRDARPLPDVQLRLHQGAAPQAKGAPVLPWCAATPSLLALPSPYEADCVYHHRYVFTLEHHRRMLVEGAAPPPAAFPWARRRARAVWRGTCTGRGRIQGGRTRVATLSRAHPEQLDAVSSP